MHREAYRQRKRDETIMHREKPKIEFQGLRKWMQRGEYIISTIADDGMIWTYTTTTLPIFDFKTTKIFQAQESGLAEIKGVERGDEFYFSIQGIKVSKVYDFYYPEDQYE
jgi:hypothetical protein